MQWMASAVEVPHGDFVDVYVLVTAGVANSEARFPVVINLLLDRSASMKGAPLSAALEAAAQLVENAKPDDCLGLVLFDAVVEQRVPVSFMDANGKQLMLDALKDVQAGRGTALHQAVTFGFQGLQRTLVPGRQPQLLLLTDGEPSVGLEAVAAFAELGRTLAKANVQVHALGLSRHYIADILDALTQPCGNAFEHVDGPEGLSEAFGSLCARLFGYSASGVSLSVKLSGLTSITCRHAFPSELLQEALVVTLGNIPRGLTRRVLFSGTVAGDADWKLFLEGTAQKEHQHIPIQLQTMNSPEARTVLSVRHELELVRAETNAWLSLARKSIGRAEELLKDAENNLESIVSLAPTDISVHRHQARLGDLRRAVERGEGDIPLLTRRAQSAHANTSISQIIPIDAKR